MLRPGFEPESSARKAGMIGRTTLPERCELIFKEVQKRHKEREMLRPGFEPESSARKAGMIGRTTLPEHIDFTLIERFQHNAYML
jgi:hypothetical protein